MWQKTLLLLYSVSALASFPNTYTPEQNLPWYVLVRAEARVEEMKFAEMVGYLWKYYKTKKTAPAEELAYFEKQKNLLRVLQNEPRHPSSQKAELGLGGDVMWIRDNWSTFLSRDTKDYLQTADGWVANLETPISTHHPVRTFLPDYMKYNSDKALVTSFRHDNGKNLFAALSTANNHSFDMEDLGARDTVKLLQTEGIAQSGIRENTNKKAWSEFPLRGFRIGFYAATFGLNAAADLKRANVHINTFPGIAPENATPDFQEIQTVLEEMKKAGIDFKIISLHWGHEFEYYPTPKLVQAAHKIVSLGADLILGNHPHVPSPDEVCFVNGYEKTLSPAIHVENDCNLTDPATHSRKAYITYAMGNFTTAMFGFSSRAIVLKKITLWKNKLGQTDWENPRYDFFYNEVSHGTRRLIPLEQYIKTVCGEEKFCSPALQEKLIFLKSFFP